MLLKRSLFRRLLFSYIITILLGFSVMGIVITLTTTDYLSETAQNEMLRQAKTINMAIQHTPEVTDELIANLHFFDQAFDRRIMVFNTSGEIIATSMVEEILVGKGIERSIVHEINQGNEVIQHMNVEGINRPTLSVIIPWGKNDELYGGIVLNSPIEGIRSTSQNIREIVLWSIIIGIVVCSMLASYLFWSISRPLKKIENVATEIALGNYDNRVEYESPDEIGELVSAFNRMAEKLAYIHAERESLQKKRDDFIANVSHELRTPLTAMQGFLEALQDGLVTDENSRRKYYDVMYEEAKHMNLLVDDLMELIKLEKKQITLDLYLIDLNDLVRKVEFSLQKQAQEKGNTINVHICENIPPLMADASRIEQVLINLVQNAIKFTEDGRIDIRVFEEGHQDEVVIEVSDTGIGIPKHDIDKIWDRFFKVSRDRSKKTGGTGLGLAIVKELIELHGGSINVNSRVGEGTTFTIRLPQKKNNEQRSE